MKLKDLKLKPGDVVRSSDGRVAEFDGTCFHFTVGYPKVIQRTELIDDDKLCEREWSLLQPAPVLGEAVAVRDLRYGDKILAIDGGGELLPGFMPAVGRKPVVLGTDGCGHYIDKYWKVYRDPRPLPALPPEPSLPDRITSYLATGGLFNPELAKHDVVRDLLIECRAALIGGSHE